MRQVAVLVVVFALMLVEARRSRRNERALRARGATEPPGDVYAVMQLLYPVAFLGPGFEGWVRPSDGLTMAIVGGAVFAAAKSLKYWAIATLGERWTFRVLVPPASQRTLAGPYRFLAHPNYVGVAGEILGSAFLVGGPWTGMVFTILFGSLMLKRIQVEERALS